MGVDRILDELCINTIRLLSVDAVEKAHSGHPGTPMGAATMAYVLWDRFLRHNPGDPRWANRDRFVLSAGHASMLLYSLLFLTGYDLSLDEIKRFRQWGSETPGHPEYAIEHGVEATTGPLGQGFANAVGMAIAERWLSATYNRPGHEIIDHFTYALCSDGDLEEGVSSEAASLAGTLGLGKLVFLYDSNSISIEGSTNLAFTENVSARFQAYGWQVIGPIDGMDISKVEAGVVAARSDILRPSLIICRTTIGYGSPNKAGTAAAHGEPLGEDEVRLTKERLNWDYAETFTVPSEVIAHMAQAQERGRVQQQDWSNGLRAYGKAHPEEARRLVENLKGELPSGWDNSIDGLFAGQSKPVSTREASGKVMSIVADSVSSFMGGAADLAPSTRTYLAGKGDFGCGNYTGRNMHFGVREHSMGAISNGMALHGGLIPFASTFLIFYDYMRPSVRLAALMGVRVVYVFTHDSIGLGEDGPTHQPVEQLMGLRCVPGLVTIRPADATETAEAWRLALERRNGPTALVLTRQNVPLLDRTTLAPASGLRRGGYVLWESARQQDAVLMATGSEVHVALEAGRQLEQMGIGCRVVSLPSWEVFDAQPAEYRDSVLPPAQRMRVSMEAATPLGWEHYVGLDGVAIGVSRFGASAPGQVVMGKLGITSKHVLEEVQRILGRR
jgi:transketolase